MTALTLTAPVRNLARVGRGVAADRVLLALAVGLLLLAFPDGHYLGIGRTAYRKRHDHVTLDLHQVSGHGIWEGRQEGLSQAPR